MNEQCDVRLSTTDGVPLALRAAEQGQESARKKERERERKKDGGGGALGSDYGALGKPGALCFAYRFSLRFWPYVSHRHRGHPPRSPPFFWHVSVPLLSLVFGRTGFFFGTILNSETSSEAMPGPSALKT